MSSTSKEVVLTGGRRQIDCELLERRLREYFVEVRHDERELRLGPRFEGGWSINTFALGVGEDDLVVRFSHENHPLGTNAAREGYVMDRAVAAGVPAPRVIAIEDDVRWLGTPFTVYERVGGTAPNVWSRRSVRHLLASRPAEEILDQLIDAARRIATVPVPTQPAELPSMLGFTKSQYSVSADVQRWTALLAETSRPRPTLSAAARWLVANAPSSSEVVFQHHDFRLGNVLFDGEGRLTGVLDWEFSGAGDPLCDIGYAAQPYCLGKLLRTDPHLQLQPDPTSWILQRYQETSSTPLEASRLRYFLALGIFKMACALVISADQWWRGNGDYRDAWLELPILSLTEDLIVAIRGLS